MGLSQFFCSIIYEVFVYYILIENAHLIIWTVLGEFAQGSTQLHQPCYIKIYGINDTVVGNTTFYIVVLFCNVQYLVYMGIVPCASVHNSEGYVLEPVCSAFCTYVLMSKNNKSPLTMSENLFKKLFSYEFHYAIYTNRFSRECINEYICRVHIFQVQSIANIIHTLSIMVITKTFL